MRNLSHPNIVRLYEVYESKANIYLVIELCTGCELFDAMKASITFSEARAANVIK